MAVTSLHSPLTVRRKGDREDFADRCPSAAFLGSAPVSEAS